MIPGSQKIERTVLKKITPTTKERKEIRSIVNSLKKQVKKEIKKTTIPIKIELVGSIAKDTFLRTSVDIDLFLLFPPNISREILQQQGLFIGRAILKNQEECFAEHPYIRGTYKGFKTEIVPCYKIEDTSQKLSAVDRTPFHTQYIKKYLKESQKKEVRLFKQFLKGIGCYGAEAEVEGFSGYLCEIMLVKYKTFQRVIEQAALWRYGEKLYLKQGVYPDFPNPLIFIDPVDSERNVASALSKEKFDLLQKACIAYQNKPRLTFFFPHELKAWSMEKIKKELHEKNCIGVIFPKPDIIPENLYPQVRKALNAIKDLCEQHDFHIIQSLYTIEKENVYIIFQMENETLSKTVLHAGPPTQLMKNVDEFLKKWAHNPRTIREPFEKNKRLYVEIERQYTDIKELLKDQITQLSLGKNIDKMVMKKITVVNKTELLREDLRLFWTCVLDPRMSWER
jgi:tRNA nucleotidyltransferase (CCA-adding enzyme)